MLLALQVPASNERGPSYAEQALAAIHQANAERLPITLMLAHHAGQAGLYVRCPQDLKAVVEQQLAAQYPNAKERLREDIFGGSKEHTTWTTELALTPDIFPLRRYSQFEDMIDRSSSDPLAGLLTAIAPSKQDSLRCRIELHVRPTSRWRHWRARRVVDRLAWPFFARHWFFSELYATAAMHRSVAVRVSAWPLLLWARLWGKAPASLAHTAGTRSHEGEDALKAAADKVGRHLFDVRLRLVVQAPAYAEKRAKRKLREIAGAFGQFTSPRLSRFHLRRIRRCNQTNMKPLSNGFLLSDEELATLWHPATQTVRAPTMRTNDSRELEAPTNIGSGKGEGEALLGTLAFRSERQAFGIKADDRRRHIAIVGKTGMGKSTLLERLIISDMQAGRGVGLVDPHGDLADAVLKAVPKRRTADVALLDASDRDYPPAFNPLACSDPLQRPLVASGVVSAFKKLYGDSWGPRLEYILRNAVLALLEAPDATLISLMRLLTDKPFRQRLLTHVTDPVVRAFWETEFGPWPPKFKAEAIAPIQNKIGQFLSNPLMRSIVGQPKGLVDLRSVMDDGRILIVNLSKGRIGDDACNLLGSLVVTALQQAAMSRADMAEPSRRDFWLYVDEFQNFATESFATILSEARKYRLGLTLANQYLAQIDEATADAVFGNVGSLLAFQVGCRDAEVLAEQFGGDLTPGDLMCLPRYMAYCRLLVDGMPSKPFSMQTLPPIGGTREDRTAIVRKVSRRRYARPLSQVNLQIENQLTLAA